MSVKEVAWSYIIFIPLASFRTNLGPKIIKIFLYLQFDVKNVNKSKKFNCADIISALERLQIEFPVE